MNSSGGSHKFRALCAGHITHDLYGKSVQPGGSVLYAANVFSALGMDCAIATSVGEDFRFDAEVAGFEVLKSVGPSTTTFENTYPEGAPRLMLVAHPAESVVPSVVDAAWRSCDVLFLAPVLSEVDMASWLQTIDAKIVGVGLQGFLKKQGESYPPNDKVHLPSPHVLGRASFTPGAFMDGVDVVFVSDEDLAFATSKNLRDELRRYAKFVALTQGEEGAQVFTPDGNFHVGIRRVDVADPTGAGDSFASGFLCGLALGYSIEDAARLGAVASSIIIGAVGIAAAKELANASSLIEQVKISRR